MITHVDGVGYVTQGRTIGELWMNIVEVVLKNGRFDLDEARGRFFVRNVRFSAESAQLPDSVIDRFGDQAKIEAMRRVVFESDVMQDFDLTPSFRTGAKSYKRRLAEGNMVSFVVQRLAKIPESKKAVMVFPTYEDYAAVTSSPWNDYLPCIVALQFRVAKRLNKSYIDQTLFMRSWDGFQKGAGDLTVVTMLRDQVLNLLQDATNQEFLPGRLDGLVTDVHIYQNTFEQAQQTHMTYLDETRK